MATLDLSALAPEPTKVKLPDGELYSMVDPDELGPLPLQRLLRTHRSAMGILAKDTPSDEDQEEMMALLVDVAQQVLPTAPRDVVGALPFRKIQALCEAFYAASPAANRAEAEPTATSA